MREYKFRGKRKDNGQWVYGNYVSTSPDEAFILLGVTGHIKRDDYECYMVEVLPETVGMWTGLADKNGREIFEGDVLQEKSIDLFEVVWDEKYCKFKLDWTKVNGNIQYPEWNRGIKMVIIGNIHDNPELSNAAGASTGTHHMQDPREGQPEGQEEATQQPAPETPPAEEQAEG